MKLLKTKLMWPVIKLFYDGSPCHTETSPLICFENQWTGFYMIGSSVIKHLSCDDCRNILKIPISNFNASLDLRQARSNSSVIWILSGLCALGVNSDPRKNLTNAESIQKLLSKEMDDWNNANASLKIEFSLKWLKEFPLSICL